MSHDTTVSDATATKLQETSQVVATTLGEAETSQASLQRIPEIGRRIRETVQKLTAIAQQTHLLALNTTIAATRSGDAGPRFAEVAHDIKNLARRTAQAAENLGGLLTEMQDSTTTTVTTIGSLSARPDRIIHITAEIPAG